MLLAMKGEDHMKRLLIVGAGDLGRETFQWARDIEKHSGIKWEVIGFLDDNLQALDKYNKSDWILGTVNEYEPLPGDELVVAIADPATKTDLFHRLSAKGAAFTTLIHPTVLLPDEYSIGKDVIIGPGSIVSIEVTIADCVIVNTLTVVGHDVVIESGCVISDYCDLMGHCYLEENVFLGSGVQILPSVRVGKNAKVGAGSVAIRRVKADTTVFGNPAKIIYSPPK